MRAPDLAPGRPYRPTRSRSGLLTLAGTVLLLGGWAAWSATQPQIVIPSPTETLAAARDLATSGELARRLTTTISRSLAGVALGVAIGGAWGLGAGRSRAIEALTRPLLATLLAVPPVVVVVFGLVWLGTNGPVPTFVVAIVSIPLLAVSTAEGIRAIDPELLEMAHTFRAPRLHVLRHVVVPSVAGPVIAALSVATAQALRVAVMAELLAAGDGIGHGIARARTNLDTAEVFAWAAVLVATALLVEATLLRPLARRATRWRDAGPGDRVPGDERRAQGTFSNVS